MSLFDDLTPEEREAIGRAWEKHEAEWVAWWDELRRCWIGSDEEIAA